MNLLEGHSLLSLLQTLQVDKVGDYLGALSKIRG